MTTLSEYNNNPGNLRPPKGLTYEGQIGVDEKGFAVFKNAEFGRKALIQDIEAKQRAGLNNPNAFINRYAPAGKDAYGDQNSEEARDNYKLHLASGLGLKSTNDPFPEDSAEKIADLITKFEGKSETPAPAPAPAPAPSPAPAPAASTTFRDQFPGVVGAGVGAFIGSTKKAQQAAGFIDSLLKGQSGQAPGMGAPTPTGAATTMPGAAPLMSGATPGGAPAAPLSVISSSAPGSAPGGLPSTPVGPADGGYMARGQTGAQVYNTAKSIGLTDIEAGQALDTTKQEGGAHDLLKKRREALLDIRQRFPSERYVENPLFGGLLTQDQGAGRGPRQSFVQQGPAASGAPPGAVPPQGTLTPLPPRVPVPTAAPPAATSLLDDAIAKLGQIAKGGLRLVSSAPVAGALGGYGAVTSGQEALERSQKGDIAGRNIAGLGTLQALAAIPTPVTEGIGLAAGIASPLGLAVLDRMRKIQAEPTPAPATEAEMQQAQQPAFRYARP